jgi:hypothetical protein
MLSGKGRLPTYLPLRERQVAYTREEYDKEVEQRVREIHQQLKRGPSTQDHGVLGNLACILDHIIPDPPDVLGERPTYLPAELVRLQKENAKLTNQILDMTASSRQRLAAEITVGLVIAFSLFCLVIASRILES